MHHDEGWLIVQTTESPMDCLSVCVVTKNGVRKRTRIPWGRNALGMTTRPKVGDILNANRRGMNPAWGQEVDDQGRVL